MSNLDGYQLLRALRAAGHDESSLPVLDPQLLIATVASLCSRKA